MDFIPLKRNYHIDLGYLGYIEAWEDVCTRLLWSGAWSWRHFLISETTFLTK